MVGSKGLPAAAVVLDQTQVHAAGNRQQAPYEGPVVQLRLRSHPAELNRSFARVSGALLIEVRHCDAEQATRLEAPLQELIRTASLEPEAPPPSP